MQFRVEFRAHRNEAHRHNILNSAACDLPSNLCSGTVLSVTPWTSKNPDTVNIEGEKRQAGESCQLNNDDDDDDIREDFWFY